MGQSSGDSSGETTEAATLSLVPGLLANYFLGTGLVADDKGFQFAESGAEGDLFGGQGAQGDPNALVSNIMGLTDPNINPGIPGGQFFQGLGQLGGEAAAATAFGNVLPTLQEGLATGFKTDLAPVKQAAQRQFFEEIVPGIQQQNVFSNEGGAFGTDVTGQLFDAGQDLSTELGALETQLGESAAGRRSQLTGLSGSLLGQLQGLPFESGFSTMDLGEQLALQGTQAGRQAQVLQLLSGITPSQPIQGQRSRSSSKGGGV